MELDNKSITTQDPQEGIKWKRNMCSKCIFNNERYCFHYKKDRLEVPVDIFNCPSFEPREGSVNKEASDIFGVEVNN